MSSDRRSVNTTTVLQVKAADSKNKQERKTIKLSDLKTRIEELTEKNLQSKTNL